MKKIIAAAVASAFIAPAFAIEFSGELEYKFIDTDAGSEAKVDETNFGVSHTVELPSGITVKGAIDFEGPQSANDGDGTTHVFASDGGSITFSGAFGSVQLGDAAGAYDKVDGMTAVSPANNGSVDELGKDSAVLVSLPAFAGLAVHASMSPDTSFTSTEDDMTSYAATYSLEGLKVAYGVQTLGDDLDDTLTAVSYSMGGLYLAYSAAEEEKAGDNTDHTSIGVSYSLGDVKLGLQQDESKTGATVGADLNFMFVSYSLGEGVTVYLESKDDKLDAEKDATTAGVKFKF